MTLSETHFAFAVRDVTESQQKYLLKYDILIEVVVEQGRKCAMVNPTVVDSIPNLRMKYLIFLLRRFRKRGKARD